MAESKWEGTCEEARQKEATLGLTNTNNKQRRSTWELIKNKQTSKSISTHPGCICNPRNYISSLNICTWEHNVTSRKDMLSKWAEKAILYHACQLWTWLVKMGILLQSLSFTKTKATIKCFSKSLYILCSQNLHTFFKWFSIPLVPAPL